MLQRVMYNYPWKNNYEFPVISLMKKWTYSISLFLFTLIAITLTGCSSINIYIGSGQPDQSQSPLLLISGMSLGQTFTTNQNGLVGVEVFLIPKLAGNGQIGFKLFKNTSDTSPVAEDSISLNSITNPGWYQFTFPIRSENNPADYYFTLQLEGTGQVAVADSDGTSYIDGSAYENDQPAKNAQLAFQNLYDRRTLVLGLLSQGLQWLVWLGLATLLFVLPGWVILSHLLPEWPTYFIGERLGLAIGISLPIYPLLFL